MLAWPYAIPIWLDFSVGFLPSERDLFVMSCNGSLFYIHFWFVFFVFLLLRKPDLDRDPSWFLLTVPFLGLVELSTLLRTRSLWASSSSSSSLVLNPSKKEWSSAYFAVSRSFGSIVRRPCIKSIPYSESLLWYRLVNVSGLVTSGNLQPTNLGFWANYSFCKPVRAPRVFWISKSWSISLSPGKRGSPSVISPMIHPIAHMSTSWLYRSLSNNSGLLYHLVAT